MKSGMGVSGLGGVGVLALTCWGIGTGRAFFIGVDGGVFSTTGGGVFSTTGGDGVGSLTGDGGRGLFTKGGGMGFSGLTSRFRADGGILGLASAGDGLVLSRSESLGDLGVESLSSCKLVVDVSFVLVHNITRSLCS